MFTVRLGPDRDSHKLGVGVASPFDLVQLRIFNGDAAAAANFRVLVEAVMM